MHNSASNSRAVLRQKRKLRSTPAQELTYRVIRKFEDGARCHLSLSAWPRMVQTGVLCRSISMLLTILYITRWLILFFYDFPVRWPSSNTECVRSSQSGQSTICLHAVGSTESLAILHRHLEDRVISGLNFMSPIAESDAIKLVCPLSRQYISLYLSFVKRKDYMI